MELQVQQQVEHLYQQILVLLLGQHKHLIGKLQKYFFMMWLLG